MQIGLVMRVLAAFFKKLNWILYNNLLKDQAKKI